MSRSSRYLFVAIALLLSTTLTVSVYAKKGGGGKPGGEDPPPELPPVRYQIQFFDMPNLSAGSIFGANNSGQAVGWYPVDENGSYRAYVFDPLVDANQAIDLNSIVAGIPDGWVIRKAMAINEIGDIAAYLHTSDSSGSIYQAVMIDMNAVIPTLHIIPDSLLTNYSLVTDMNDFGDIVVRFRQDGGPWESYVYNFGFYDASLQMEMPLELPVYGSGKMQINNAGQIVGESQDGTPYRISLDGAFKEFGGLGLEGIQGLNDAGEFCGRATIQIRKNRTARSAYVMGSELEVFDTGYEALDLNNMSDFVTTENLYHRDWEFLDPIDLLDGSDPDVATWNSLENRLQRLSDRDESSSFPLLFGQSNDSSYSVFTCFVLTPVPAP